MSSASESPQLIAARDTAIVADLARDTMIVATGDDATAFLHGQFTNDVQGLPVDSAQWTGWCTPKGRLVASMLLVRLADRYLMVLPAEIAAGFRKRLSMYVLRSKVKLADPDAGTALIGVAGPRAQAVIAERFGSAPAPMRVLRADAALVVALDAQRYIVIASMENAPQVRSDLEGKGVPASADAWEWTGIRAGIPTIVAATQEAFVPQMANFDLIGAVSFHKGCYPGQEIVARTQYRGGLKRRMALAHIDAEAPPAAGESVYSDTFGDQAAGTIANVAPSPEGGFDALVVAQIEGLERGDLHAGSLHGPPVKILSRLRADTAS